jgi:8-oxo-dGTP diphosphatase
MYTYEYPRPAVTTDAVIFAKKKDTTSILLIKRGRPPFEGMWALPGGFLNIDEEPEDVVKRELEEESGLTGIKLQQLKAYGAVHRDPRHRTISIVFYGITDREHEVKGMDDAAEAKWFPIDNLPPMAFDHEQIVADAIEAAKLK